MYAHLQKDASNPIIEPRYWMLNTSRLHFARVFPFIILVERAELTTNDDDEFVEIQTYNRQKDRFVNFESLEFSDDDLKLIVAALGSDYDQTNLDTYHFIVRSELIAENYEYFIELIN